MSDLGNCPRCGTPYSGRRRCWKCTPIHRSKGVVGLAVEPKPSEVDLAEVQARKLALKAEKAQANGSPEPEPPDREELLRRAHDARVAEKQAEARARAEAEREAVRAERGRSIAPIRPEGDPELAAFGLLVRTIEALDPAARRRAPAYLGDRFGEPDE